MPAAIDTSLRTAHRTVLAMIAMCAVISVIQAGPDSGLAPDPTITTIAVALALGTILTRRAATSPKVAPQTSLVLILCAYSLAFGLALLGSYLAITAEQKQTGLLFALGAGILCLRPLARTSSG